MSMHTAPMTDTTTAGNGPGQPLGLGCNEQLGAGSEARGSFAPTVKMPGGEVVSPEGWMWVLGFALGGCQWAIDEAERMGLQQKAADYRRRQSLYWAELEVAALEARLTEQRALVAQLQAPNVANEAQPR